MRESLSVLVVGVTGATGRLLVEELIDRGHRVLAVVRSPDKLPSKLRSHDHVSLVKGGVLDLTDLELSRQVQGCDAVASCLGHTISWKGIFGPPHRLVADATRRLCNAIRSHSPSQPVKFVLMNTTAHRNGDLPERRSLAERTLFGMTRLLLPPQRDNEMAADYLRVTIGQADPAIAWAVVRPDTLINEAKSSAYDLHPSPIRSPVFNAGTTSRINVAHFMADLITEQAIWSQWKGKMPVIYNRAPAK